MKLGKGVAVWGTKNIADDSISCVVTKLKRHWRSHWLAGETFGRHSPLFARHVYKNGILNIQNMVVSNLTKFFKTVGSLLKIDNVKTHSCRKGFFTMAASAGINLRFAYLLSRAADGTAEKHYISLMSETIVYYLRILYMWADVGIIAIRNNSCVTRHQYLHNF